MKKQIILLADDDEPIFKLTFDDREETEVSLEDREINWTWVKKIVIKNVEK